MSASVAPWASLPLLHEDEALADLAQQLDVVRLVGMQADEHHPALVPQAAEEVEHEADVAVLRVELRLVEEVDQRLSLRARSSRNDGFVRRNERTW